MISVFYYSFRKQPDSAVKAFLALISHSKDGRNGKGKVLQKKYDLNRDRSQKLLEVEIIFVNRWQAKVQRKRRPCRQRRTSISLLWQGQKEREKISSKHSGSS
jgi:hypothetical protein